MIKRIIFKLLPRKIKICEDIYKIFNTELGYWNSIKTKSSIDTNSDPIPWYTYPAIAYIKQFDFSDKFIFEWGAGYSSLFWSNKAKDVTSVDDSQEWTEKIKEKVNNNNLHLHLIQNRENYVNFISKQNVKFDVIIIDGKNRLDCTKIAKSFLNKGGLIILDNSDLNLESSRVLREFNLLQVDFRGFGPLNNYMWTTSLFFDRDFNFKTIKNNQPIHST